LGIFLASTLAAAAATFAVKASATFRVVNSFDCQARSGSLTRDHLKGSSSNNSTTADVWLVCPIPDDSWLPILANTTSLRAEFVDASTTEWVSVQACSTQAAVDIASCSATGSSGLAFTGVSAFRLNAAWAGMTVGAFPWVHIVLPNRNLPALPAAQFYSSIRALRLEN